MHDLPSWTDCTSASVSSRSNAGMPVPWCGPFLGPKLTFHCATRRCELCKHISKYYESPKRGFNLALQKFGSQTKHGSSCRGLRTLPGTCPLEMLTLIRHLTLHQGTRAEFVPSPFEVQQEPPCWCLESHFKKTSPGVKHRPKLQPPPSAHQAHCQPTAELRLWPSR